MCASSIIGYIKFSCSSFNFLCGHFLIDNNNINNNGNKKCHKLSIAHLIHWIPSITLLIVVLPSLSHTLYSYFRHPEQPLILPVSCFAKEEKNTKQQKSLHGFLLGYQHVSHMVDVKSRFMFW